MVILKNLLASGRFSWRASAAANAPGARASNGSSPMSMVSTPSDVV